MYSLLLFFSYSRTIENIGPSITIAARTIPSVVDSFIPRTTSIHTSGLRTDEYLAESESLANAAPHCSQSLSFVQRDLEEKKRTFFYFGDQCL